MSAVPAAASPVSNEPTEGDALAGPDRWRSWVAGRGRSWWLTLVGAWVAGRVLVALGVLGAAQFADAAAERDAARYRYLRDDGYGITIDVLEYDDDGGEDWVSGHSPADLDAAIDRFRQPDNGGIPSP